MEKKTTGSPSIKPSSQVEESDEEDLSSDPNVIDVSNFFQYQKALNSLIDYLNQSIDDAIAGFTRSDQLLFTHSSKKLILNAILESGFYDFCKFRLREIATNQDFENQEKFLETMGQVQGEIDLLAYLLVNTRLAHRTLNFDLFLSLLKGGLFIDVMEIHERIVRDMRERAQQVNKTNIKENIKVSPDSHFYI